MILTIYSIFDTAAGAYMRPFFLQSDGQATRMFSDIATDPEHEVGKHPEDYTLVSIGTFNDNNGDIEPFKVTAIATALELVAAVRNKQGSQQALLAEMQQRESTLRKNGHSTETQNNA